MTIEIYSTEILIDHLHYLDIEPKMFQYLANYIEEGNAVTVVDNVLLCNGLGLALNPLVDVQEAIERLCEELQTEVVVYDARGDVYA